MLHEACHHGSIKQMVVFSPGATLCLFMINHVQRSVDAEKPFYCYDVTTGNKENKQYLQPQPCFNRLYLYMCPVYTQFKVT